MNRAAGVPQALDGHAPEALSVEAVQAFLARLATPATGRRPEPVPLHQALDRVLAQDVVSPFDVPPHDNSAMDGFAFDGAVLDGATGTLRLRIAGSALAGTCWRGRIDPGAAVRVTTGAMMPPGLDTVVPQELCTVTGAELRFAAAAVRQGANRRRAGEDLAAGRAALQAGDRLGPAALGLAASLGLATLPVWPRLRVACFSTGNEILSLGDAPRAGAVYDSNRYTLLGLLTRLGCEVLDLGVVRDDPATLEAALRGAARQADAIITSGGVSVGEADHTRDVMQRLGEIAFWRIAMRPGRPMAAGRIAHDDGRDTVLFGLPGNPVAAMVTFLAFVRPALLQRMGCNAAHRAPPPLLRATTASAIRKKPGRTEYQRGFVRTVPGALPEVRVAAHQGSGVLRSMAEANGLVVLHHDQGSVAAGEAVDVMLFDGCI